MEPAHERAAQSIGNKTRTQIRLWRSGGTGGIGGVGSGSGGNGSVGGGSGGTGAGSG